MKNMNVNYRIFSDNIDKNIVLLSDLHDYPGDRKTTLVQDIQENNPNLVIISGDILHGSKYVMESDRQKDLKRFLSELSESCPVILGLGNHDLMCFNKDSEKGYRDLETARPGRVFPLNNESVISDEVRVIEFHPRHAAFAPAVQDSGKGLLMFAEDFAKEGITPPRQSGLYNILICHNPKTYAQARSVGEQRKLKFSEEQLESLSMLKDEMKKMDLVCAGHLHNGYYPLKKTATNPSKYMDEGYWEMPQEKNVKGHIVAVRPWVYKKTDMCRGTIFVGDEEERIIELCDGSYFLKPTKESKPIPVAAAVATRIIKAKEMTPIVISGGVNKFFNLPIDSAEITNVKILKR